MNRRWVILLTIISSTFSALTDSVHKDNSLKTPFPIYLSHFFPKEIYFSNDYIYTLKLKFIFLFMFLLFMPHCKRFLGKQLTFTVPDHSRTHENEVA